MMVYNEANGRSAETTVMFHHTQSYAQGYLSLIVGCTGQHFQHLCKKLVHDTTGLVARGQ